MRRILLFSFLIICNFIYSQVAPSSIDPTGLTYGGSPMNNGLDFDTVLGRMLNQYKEKKDFDINKEPFLFKNWQNNLKIVTIKGDVFKLKSSNYHVQNDYIVSKISKDSIFIWNSSGVDYYLLNNLKFKKIKGKHVQVLLEGKKENLYKEYFAKRIEKSFKDNPLAIPTKEKSKIKIKSIYYLVNNSGIKRKIKLKKKNILKHISNSATIKKFAKNNRLSFKKESDVVKILNYYNTL